MQNHIFVYGTLRRTYTNKYARFLHASATYKGKARMSGRKVKAGRYFGLTPPLAENDWVEGEVFEIHTPAAILQELDTYEGPSYRREIRPATLQTGEQLDCWVYLYLHNGFADPK